MFTLIMFLYFISDCYLFNSSLTIFHLPSCTDHISQSSYYRKRWQDRNFTFYVYNIQIGKLYIDALKLSQFDIHNLSQQISNDILHWNHSTTEKKGALRRDLFLSYFDEITHPALNQRDHGVPCISVQNSDENHFDFFEFIHFGHDHFLSNQTNQTIVNWYDLLPIEDLFNGSYLTASSAHPQLSAEYLSHSMDSDSPFYLPSLYTYTISVDISGFLPTLELRIGEIVHPMQQHNMMKHLNLNNNQKHLLWAGELYAIYDHKYKRYVMLMDNASGHWKPKAHKFPQYLHRILMKTLFPGIEVPWKESVGDAMHSISFVDYYRPFATVGFYDEPFHKLKKVMFPILGEIKVFEKEHRAEKKRKKQQKKLLELHDQKNMDKNQNSNVNNTGSGLESEPKTTVNLTDAHDVKEILTRFIESKVNRGNLSVFDEIHRNTTLNSILTVSDDMQTLKSSFSRYRMFLKCT